MSVNEASLPSAADAAEKVGYFKERSHYCHPPLYNNNQLIIFQPERILSF